jgi:X-X-X-Leu-X-X-Gly heptad repeat protein
VTPEFKVTLDIAQLIMLGALVWGLARMSAAVDSLRDATGKLTTGLEQVVNGMADLSGRVRVLEDRGQR